jgi:hypothetical protein
MLLWIIGAFVVFSWANNSSDLVGNGGTRRGVYRTALDLSEAVKEVLGKNSCSYTNDELEVLLETRKVAYCTGDASSRVAHLGISSCNQRRLNLERGRLYGGCK